MRSRFVVVVTLALGACSAGVDESASSESVEHQMTREEFDGYLRALQAHDYDAFASFYTDDFKAHIYMPPAPAGGPLDSAGAQEMERSMAEHWNWTMDVHQVVYGADGIAVRATMRGPLLKPWPGTPADGPKAGDEFVGGFASFYQLRGNKISELWVVANQW